MTFSNEDQTNKCLMPQLLYQNYQAIFLAQLQMRKFYHGLQLVLELQTVYYHQIQFLLTLQQLARHKYYIQRSMNLSIEVHLLLPMICNIHPESQLLPFLMHNQAAIPIISPLTGALVAKNGCNNRRQIINEIIIADRKTIHPNQVNP